MFYSFYYSVVVILFLLLFSCSLTYLLLFELRRSIIPPSREHPYFAETYRQDTKTVSADCVTKKTAWQ